LIQRGITGVWRGDNSGWKRIAGFFGEGSVFSEQGNRDFDFEYGV
jgi:hypothetical protein